MILSGPGRPLARRGARWCLAALCAAGCTRSADAPSQAGRGPARSETSTQRELKAGGNLIAAGFPTRPYELRVPEGVLGPLPLVVALHCFTCDAEEFGKMLGLGKLADATSALVAIPRGLRTNDGRPFWNARARGERETCCDLDGKAPDDVAYLRAVVADVRRRQAVDDRRVFAVGVSNGGFMAHRLACDASDVFTGIASLSGAGTETCAATLPVAVLQIHGDRDEVVPFEGGDVIVPGLPKPRRSPAIEPTLRDWRRRDRCQDQPDFEPGKLDLILGVPGNETDVTTFACEAGGVALWKMKGGRHVERYREEILALAVRWLIERPRK